MQTPAKLAPYRTAVAVLAFAAFFLSAMISGRIFERLPHMEDEIAYFYQAKIFARGNLAVETPYPPRAYWQVFVADHNGKRFSKYTPGWAMLLSLGFNMGQPWVINAFFAMLAVPLVWQLGSRLFNRDVGLMAAGLTAFSPMALLLNGSLMGHAATFFFTMLFLLAYRQIEKTHRLHWGVAAGVALGWVFILRPMTALGIALPFIIWSALRLLDSLLPNDAKSSRWLQAWRTLLPLLALSLVTLLIATMIPLHNYAATGDASSNLYTYIWEYDQPGFGECCGRSGHTLYKAVWHARYDLSLTAADTFGWQIGELSAEAKKHLLEENDYYPNLGLSFVLFPFGILLGFLALPHRPARRWLAVVLLFIWLVGVAALLSLALDGDSPRVYNAAFAWQWVMTAAVWLCAPLILLRDARCWQTRWVWLLVCLVLALVLVHMTYWIGFQRYSTRYYFEGLGAFAIVSALPLAWLARRFSRWLVYLLLTAVLLFSLFSYGLPRVGVLHRYHRIHPDIIAAIKSRQVDNQPLLALVGGADSGENRARWHSLGTLMAVTSPYLDSEIVGAVYYENQEVKAEILANHPDRQVIEMFAQGQEIEFMDNMRG